MSLTGALLSVLTLTSPRCLVGRLPRGDEAGVAAEEEEVEVEWGRGKAGLVAAVVG